ncbi:DUF3515 family protein [Catellatospora citrea]|uniref:DUF3515 family protein n=1 Tax=Catellatospora citrea TaxID=53366 RepID=A0A8J3P3X2_9ACTN|nr:DUF3515 family protein [Catellatospora citrea]RKE09889.1 uncharacterized protein DUF3515 [Catellatospora citrea]GIG02764.1 hypothetical protein Cci01nite_78570 [Catellatospora citrea]
MSNDQTARSGRPSAKTIATVVALPIALLAGFGFFQAMRPPAEPAPEPSVAAGPQVMPTTPVTMDAPALTERQATVCRALLSQLPDQVRELPRRAVTAGHEQNAAYGEPALTLACGGPSPSYPPTDDVYTLDGVCWHKGDGAWTTVDREVPVRVTVPAAYDPAGQWVINFSKTLIATVPHAERIPPGCGTRA